MESSSPTTVKLTLATGLLKRATSSSYCLSSSSSGKGGGLAAAFLLCAGGELEHAVAGVLGLVVDTDREEGGDDIVFVGGGIIQSMQREWGHMVTRTMAPAMPREPRCEQDALATAASLVQGEVAPLA